MLCLVLNLDPTVMTGSTLAMQSTSFRGEVVHELTPWPLQQVAEWQSKATQGDKGLF